MEKIKRRRIWIIVTVVTLITVGVLLFPVTNSVGAMFGDEHVVEILWRVRNEIMQKSPAGRYYEAMLWKHSDELGTLLVPNNLEHVMEFLHVTRMFIPGLEALLDGKGNTVRITKEQVNSLKAELDWMASVGNPSLREDIEKEQQRFPLKKFIGMTMSEALDYINSNFPPDLTLEFIAATIEITKTPQPTSTPRCIIGTSSNCLAEPLLVPESNGQWAYYIFNNVYFEYPSTWYVQQNGKQDVIILLPAQGSPERMNFDLLAFTISLNLPIENWNQVLTDPLPQWERPNTEWKQLIYLNDFQGFENLWKYSDSSTTDLEFFLYNENRQLAIDFLARTKDKSVAKLIDGPDVVKELFPNIQYIIESLRYWKP